MITAGIDVGARTVKALILEGGKVIGRGLALTGFDQKESAEQALQEALRAAGLAAGDVEAIVATGAGRKEVPFARDGVTEVISAARGAVFLYPSARTVIDVGAEEGRALKVDAAGKVLDFAVNEKCAAGAGSFVEAMARALELRLEDMGALSLTSRNEVPMNAQCVIFAESEVVSLIHARTPKEDIVRAIHDAIASRISSMVRRVGIEKEVALVGGMARNVGFIDSLRRDLGLDFLIPEDPEFVGALGAALIAAGSMAPAGSGWR